MAKILDVAKDAFNLFKGIGLEKTATGADSQFNLNNFIGKMQERNSLARANRYVVRIATPPWGGAAAAQDLVFFCDNVNLPGASVVPVDIKRNSIGPFDRRPSNVIPDEITASFMLDSAGQNLKFFHDWLANIMGIDDSAGGATSPDANGAKYDELHYRDRYVTTMEIETYDMAANKIHTVKCFEVWPSQISPVTLGWAQNDEYARVQVNFQLRFFTSETTESPTEATGERELTAMEQLLRIGQAAKALKSSWKKPTNVGDVINVVSNGQTFLKTLGGKT